MLHRGISTNRYIQSVYARVIQLIFSWFVYLHHFNTIEMEDGYGVHHFNTIEMEAGYGVHHFNTIEMEAGYGLQHFNTIEMEAGYGLHWNQDFTMRL